MSEQDDKLRGSGRAQGGDSGGGAYPNPHADKKPKKQGFLGTGGQSGMGYHGHGQLGDRKLDDNANAPARGEKD